MRFLFYILIFFSNIALAQNGIVSEDITSEVKAELAVASTTNTMPAEESTTEPKVDNRKESEIPLNLENKKSASAEDGNFLRIFMTLSILSVVGAGSFFLLRKYSVPRAAKHQTQIKVLQQHYLGPKKSLAIVRVAGESILLGVTEHNITMIMSLSLLDEEVPEETPGNFGKTLKGQIGHAEFVEEDENDQKLIKGKSGFKLDNEEEFAISGIKDIVSKRLKGMRSF